ncbi:MAG: hypothetical protein LBV71_20570 [Prevotella sp.]|nr:hypothetical protein [Prevotella sp.]
MKNLKVVVYFLFSLFLISGCSNSVNEEYEDNNEIAKQQEVVYEYFVDADSLVVHTDPGTKAEKQPDIPKPGGGGGDSGTGSPCWCMEPPQILHVERQVAVGERIQITFGGASKVTYQGVGGGLSFAVANGVGTLTILKKGVYTNFETTAWRKQCDYTEVVHCPTYTTKWRIVADLPVPSRE